MPLWMESALLVTGWLAVAAAVGVVIGVFIGEGWGYARGQRDLRIAQSRPAQRIAARWRA